MPLALLSPKKRRSAQTIGTSPAELPKKLSLSPPPAYKLTEQLTPPQTMGSRTSGAKNSSEDSSNYSESVPSSPNAYRSMSLKLETSSTHSSIHKRTLSDKVKATPSSLVRRLRLYSSPSGSDPNINNINMKSLLLQNKEITDSLPKELAPVVNLILAHKLTTYAVGSLEVPAFDEANQRIWLTVDAKLTGNELAIWRSSKEDYTILGGNDEYKPNYINLIDSNIELLSERKIKIFQDFKDENALLIHFPTDEEYIRWIAAIQLASFEYVSLNEAFTAVMLSLKGPKLSDIHILLLPKKRFPKFEWCNLRLPQVSSKWLKVYVAIIPSESKKKGRIEIYTSDKINKKNLIIYIPDASSVFNVYPETASMIDFNSILKLNGEIYINKQYEHLFIHNDTHNQGSSRSFSFKMHSKEESFTSLTSLDRSQSTGGRTRSTSSSSTSSFFSTASSPAPSSKESAKGVTSYIKKNLNHFVVTNYVYLMPIPHPGVSAIEIMIRNFIHIIDSFKLYGRPDQLVSDKTNENSMLFGMPSLPHHKYLSMDEAMKVVRDNLKTAQYDNWNKFQWRTALKSEISKLYSLGAYKGRGDITTLYSQLDLNFGEISSPSINFPSGGQSPLPSPLPPNGYEFENFSDSAMSPLNSLYNFQVPGLGEPIDLGRGEKKLPRSFDSKFNSLNTDKPLPSIDRTLTLDHNHPYSTFVNLTLNEDE
ncbi:uncharacterized protein PRCAT00001128001 [Priceomyces carsonii]|uniref:uncharacterized protein n=1 Tax=Priceomyces carsonii TaxID=28549 RepID=UPI002ED9B6F7|nr:unnamed protein product [Priceomyces carsonii]